MQPLESRVSLLLYTEHKNRRNAMIYSETGFYYF